MSNQVLQMESYILPAGGAASKSTGRAEWNKNIIEKVRTYHWRILKVYPTEYRFLKFWMRRRKKQTAVSEAWSGQRPQCSWNLGIAPGLGRTLEVWGFGRWWGAHKWFKTQPFLTCLSSQKKATMEMQVYRVLCWTSGKMFFLSFGGGKQKVPCHPMSSQGLDLQTEGEHCHTKKREKNWHFTKSWSVFMEVPFHGL